MMLACGLMIDGYNLYSTDQALQRTVDAAALAAAADNTDMTTAHAQSLAFNYLDHSPNLANITITGRTATSDTTARTVTVTLDAEFPTYFMKIVQVNTMKVSITSRAERAQPGPLDLVLALDTTQSMNSPPQGGVETKITTLRSAATALVNQVMATGSPQIQVGIVPYSAYMNVGPISPVPDWVNAISRTMTSCKSYPPGCPLVYYDCLVDGVFTTNGCGKRNCECAVWQKETYDWKGCIGPRSINGWIVDGHGSLPGVNQQSHISEISRSGIKLYQLRCKRIGAPSADDEPQFGAEQDQHAENLGRDLHSLGPHLGLERSGAGRTL